MNFAVIFLLTLNGVEAHGRLTNVGSGTTRIGSRTRYENDPVPGKNTGEQWICRNGVKKTSQADLVPNGQLALQWNFGAAHVGDCAVYLSYDVDQPRAQQKWFKIANLYDCKSQNRQTVNIKIPGWLKAGPAVLRWDWYALHVWPAVEFYSQCSDVTITNVGQTAVNPKTYLVNTNTAYPPSGTSGKGYRNPWDRNSDQSMTGPSCANGYTGNNCGLTAVGTQRNTIDGGGAGASNPAPVQPTQAPPSNNNPQPQPPVTPECPNHVIQPGDTLGKIAQEYVNKGYSITWQEICEFNALENCNMISPGEVIIIPVEKCKDAGKDTGAKPGAGDGAGTGAGNAGSKPEGGDATDTGDAGAKPEGGDSTGTGDAGAKPEGGDSTGTGDAGTKPDEDDGTASGTGNAGAKTGKDDYNQAVDGGSIAAVTVSAGAVVLSHVLS